MSYPIVGSLGTPALVGIIGNIHQRLYPLYSHGFSALSPADSNVPQILHHSEANWQIALLTCSGRVLLRCWNATTILYFFLQESWRCIVSTKCWRRLGLLQWTRLRVEGKECEGSAFLTYRNFFHIFRWLVNFLPGQTQHLHQQIPHPHHLLILGLRLVD